MSPKRCASLCFLSVCFFPFGSMMGLILNHHPLPTVLSRLIHPQRGVRVGEASHPGPASQRDPPLHPSSSSPRALAPPEIPEPGRDADEINDLFRELNSGASVAGVPSPGQPSPLAPPTQAPPAPPTPPCSSALLDMYGTQDLPIQVDMLAGGLRTLKCYPNKRNRSCGGPWVLVELASPTRPKMARPLHSRAGWTNIKVTSVRLATRRLCLP